MCLALKDWNSLYTESAGIVWKEERIELKKAAMLIHVLGLELERIKESAAIEVNTLREKLNEKDAKDKKKSPLPSSPKIASGKENCVKGITALPILNKRESLNASYVSPDMFNCAILPLDNKSPQSEANIISSEDEPTFPRSPKIKKCKTVYSRRKKDVVKFINKHYNIKKGSEDNASSQDEIIEATPQPVNKQKQRSYNKSKLKMQKVNLFNKTLTQMFPASNPVNSKKGPEKQFDSEATICEPTMPLAEPPSMQIEDILNLLSKNRNEAVTPSKDIQISDSQDFIIDVNKVPKKQMIGQNNSETKIDFEDFIKNYDKVPEKVQEEPKKKFCKLCHKLGKKCRRHMDDSEYVLQKTFTGFWDVDFTVHDTPPPPENDESQILL